MLFRKKCMLIERYLRTFTGQQISNAHFSNSSMSFYIWIGNTLYRLSNHGPHSSFTGKSFYMVWNTDIFEIIFGIIYETWIYVKL